MCLSDPGVRPTSRQKLIGAFNEEETLKHLSAWGVPSREGVQRIGGLSPDMAGHAGTGGLQTSIGQLKHQS